MTDITANVIVSMPSQLFTMARSFKAVANGKIYIGKIDTDPVNPENQIQVYVENEDGSHVSVAQPIIINAAGYPVYNGQIAKFVTVQGHSMAVYDAYGAQQFYFPNVLKYDPDQFRAIIESPEGAGHVGYQYRRNTGSTMRMVSDVLDERVSLWDFHCDSSGNVIHPGPNVDSRQYLQAAIDYVSSNGGGTITIPAGYTWYLGSYGVGGIAGHSGIIQLRSNVNLNIEGRIHLSPFFDLKPFQVFVGFDNADPSASGNLNNCNIFGRGVIDFGGYNFGSTSQLRCGIAFGRSYNCSVTGITFQNGDVTWAITLGWNGYGLDCTVSNCKFINLIESTNNADHSTVYVNCPFSGVDNCIFRAVSSRAQVIACSVELHQHNTFYRQSYITGYCRGCYIVMHAAEAAGAGTYTYNVNVESISGNISGQFCILGSDEYNGIYSHVSGVTISNNNINISERAEFSAPFGAFIDIAPDNLGRRDVQDVSNVLVTGNSFRAPINVTDSAALTVNAKLNGITFSDNFFDCRYMVYGDNLTTSVKLSGLVWSDSNTIGPGHSGQRSNLNLFNMMFGTVVNSSINIRLSSEDTSMFSCILFPSNCSISYTSVCVEPDFTKNMSNTAVFEGGQQGGDNVYVSYPALVSLTSYNTVGAVPFFSTDAIYNWVTNAYLLNSGGSSDYNLPPSFTSKINGQLYGIGFNETGGNRSASIRLMLRRCV
nr:hypothetical protein [Escherichia coli]